MRASIRLGIGTIVAILLAIIFLILAVVLYNTGLLPIAGSISNITGQTGVSLP